MHYVERETLLYLLASADSAEGSRPTSRRRWLQPPTYYPRCPSSTLPNGHALPWIPTVPTTSTLSPCPLLLAAHRHRRWQQLRGRGGAATFSNSVAAASLAISVIFSQRSVHSCLGIVIIVSRQAMRSARWLL
jgi:hypothetical protein